MRRTLLVAITVFGFVGGAALTPTMAADSVGIADSATTADSVAQTDEADLPPGLSEEGVTDPLALVSAHRQALENTSYVISTTTTYRRPNGTLVAQTTTSKQVAAGAETYFGASSQTIPNATRSLGVEHYDVEVWANETQSVTARNRPDGATTYRQMDRSDALMEPDGQWALLYAVLGSVDTEMVGQLERNGTTLFRVVSTPETEAGSDKLQHEFSALVDSQGIVHTILMTQRTNIEDKPAIVSRTIHVSEIGNTTVERPSWYQQAVENETE